MFEVIIEFDLKKIEEENLDLKKIDEYLDELHLCSPDITKKARGHYVGNSSPTELSYFGSAIMTLAESRWFRETVSRWELWENEEIEENIIDTLNELEKEDGKKLYE